MEIGRGAGERTMAQQSLNGGQIHPRFQKMRGETMTKAMDSTTIGQTCTLDGLPESQLHGRNGHRTIRIHAARKEPYCGTEEPPIGTQFLDQAGRKYSIPIF